MMPNSNIDELLNSFIDGELTEKEQAEIRQIIAQEPEVSVRLRQLQSCKILISSLPPSEAPSEILDEVKASLERKTLLNQQSFSFDDYRGSRHLFARKVLTAAAMLGFIAILGAVIYVIVRPQSVRQTSSGPLAFEEGPTSIYVSAGKPVDTASVVEEFNGRIEFQTGSFTAVDAYINRTIEDNGLSDYTKAVSSGNKKVYSVSCDKEHLNLLLADLGTIWQRFESATLFVETEHFGSPVIVDSATVEQTMDIVNQDSFDRRIQLAKDFATLNNIVELMPGKEVFSALDNANVDLIIPKPVLTWNQKITPKAVKPIEGKKTINVAIVLINIK